MTARYIPKRAALACAALVATGTAWAQSSGSSVNLYGVLDACVVSNKSATGAPVQINGGGCYYGSRLGFRGNEDLGGGMRAYFQLETGFAADNGTLAQGGRLFGRKSIVGLAGGLGAVEIGREYAPAFYLLTSIDPMQLGIGSALATIWSGSPGTGAGRTDNSINYQSPDLGGFAVRVQAALGEQAAPLAARGGDSKGASLTYRNKQLYAAVSYESIANPTGTADDRATTIGAKYDFGSFSLSAIAQSGAWQGTRPESAPSSATSIYSRRFNSYLVGGSVRLGGDTLNATYKRYDDRTAANFDATVLSAVYIHPLSKRTQLYGGISHLKNARASSYGASDGNGGYSGVAAGGSSRIIDLGITHFF
ncbi:porin [Caenimonas terrae]|uniref:Porin n=1 Tax=Caenimonas terrae TaxID=696074 RepID=A0ABW0NFG3_9BURK